MSLDLLDTPLRATWALSSDGHNPAADVVLTIAQRLADAGVFYLLLEPPSLEHPACREALDILSSAGCQVQVICRGDDVELSALECHRFALKNLWLDVGAFMGEGADINRLQGAIDRLRERSIEPGLLLVPDRRHILEIPQLISLCRDLGIKRFKLPNIGIDANFQDSIKARLPRAEDVSALKALLGDSFQIPPDLQLEVHDLFLWELLVTDASQGREEYGGCQAGNSLAHITSDGDVYPCLSWPEKLGSLLNEELIDIWESERRMLVRSEITEIPTGCEGCSVLDDCYGGCRGLSRIFNKKLGQRDLLCSGKR